MSKLLVPARPLQLFEIGVTKDFKLRFLQELFRRVQDNNLAESIVVSVIDHASKLLAYDQVDMLARAAQLCVMQGLGGDTQANLLEAIARAVQQELDRESTTPAVGSGEVAGQEAPALGVVSDQVAWDGGAGSGEEEAGEAWETRTSWKVVLSLLRPGLQGGGLRRASSRSTVHGMYAVQWLLKFEESIVGSVLQAVSELPLPVLAAVVRDEVGCPCVLGSVLDAARSGDDTKVSRGEARQARNMILQAFIGSLVDLACDRVAWTFLVQCFHDATCEQKT